MDDGLIQKLKLQFILWLARRLPDCKRMTRSLGESLDRKPGWKESVLMKLHLFTCEACGRYLEQIQFLKTAVHVHGAGPGDPRIELNPDSKKRLKSMLRGNMGLAI